MSSTQAQARAADTTVPTRPWLVALGVVGVGLLLVQVISTLTQVGSAEADEAIVAWSYRVLMAGAALAVFVRIALRSEDRLAWTLIGLGLVAWTIGDLYYDYALTNDRTIPYPSLSDAFYLAVYPLLIAGVRLLTARTSGVSPFSLSLVVAILGLATIWSWVVFGPVLASATGESAAIATSLAYPLLDLLLLATVFVALAVRGWRFDRVLVALAAGFAFTVVADSIVAVQVAQGSYVDGTIVNAFWPAGTMFIAAAAWSSSGSEPKRPRRDGAVVPAITAAAIALAIAALLWDHFVRLDSLTILLAGLTLIAGCAQFALLYRDRRDAMAQALRSESLRSASTRAALDCVISMDAEGQVQEWNEAASRTFGYSPAEVVGRELAELIIPAALRAQHREGLTRLIKTGETRILNRRIEATAMHADGREFPIEVAVTQVGDDPPMFTGFIRDISERKSREAENEWLAAIVRSSEDAIISRDLEGAVTAWNHGAELLYGYSAEEAIGAHLDALILPLGNDDEIGEIFDRLSAGSVAAYEAERRRKDGALVTVSMRAFAINDSAGKMVGASAIAHDITERKQREEREERDRDATLWRGRIEAALDDEGLLFFGQPVVDLSTGSIDHRELLIRMDLDGEIVPPGAFLPHAEKTELIRRVDRWAVERGIELARTGPVAINLSAKSLDDPELSDTIEEALTDRALAENVIFEITETAAASDLDHAETLVRKLTALGCGVALDDFGTGYSSFTYLKHLPVTELKIDIQFIRGLLNDSADRRVVQSMISVAQTFGIKTVAEGVEDEATLELLRELGVDLVQGYYIGYPAHISPPDDGQSQIIGTGVQPTRPHASIERVAV
jgi:PAS domain S-box-containing protein